MWSQVEVLPVDLMNWYKGDKTDKTSSLAGRQALLKSKRLRVGDIEAAVAHRLEQQQVGDCGGWVYGVSGSGLVYSQVVDEPHARG
jgi:hypothetical protein